MLQFWSRSARQLCLGDVTSTDGISTSPAAANCTNRTIAMTDKQDRPKELHTETSVGERKKNKDKKRSAQNVFLVYEAQKGVHGKVEFAPS